MCSSILRAAFAAAILVPAIAAQQVYNQADTDRRASTAFVFGQQGAMVAASISYSQPAWKADYDSQLEGLKGTKARLGKNWWTTLSTMHPLEIGGKKLAAGVWFLGLECDKAGKFFLLAMESNMAIQSKLMPWATKEWKNEIKIPLEFAKASLEKSVEKMEISLQAGKTGENGQFAIRWGTHELSGKVAFLSSPATNASAKKAGEKMEGNGKKMKNTDKK